VVALRSESPTSCEAEFLEKQPVKRPVCLGRALKGETPTSSETSLLPK
jgi:hypothetical protein